MPDACHWARATTHIRFTFIPIEDLVRVVAVVAEHDDTAGGTFHAVLAHPPTHEDLRALACKHLGLFGIDLVDGAALIDPSPLEREVARMLERIATISSTTSSSTMPTRGAC